MGGNEIISQFKCYFLLTLALRFFQNNSYGIRIWVVKGEGHLNDLFFNAICSSMYKSIIIQNILHITYLKFTLISNTLRKIPYWYDQITHNWLFSIMYRHF